MALITVPTKDVLMALITVPTKDVLMALIIIHLTKTKNSLDKLKSH